MNLEKLLGSLLQSGLSGHALGKHGLGSKKKKYKHHSSSGGLGGMASRAVFSKGGLSMLAGIGMAAYEHYRQRQQQTPGGSPPPHPTYGHGNQPPFQRPYPTTPPTFGGRAAPPPVDADLLLTAMVAAARADGVLDAEERAALEQYLHDSGADAEDWAHLERLMRQPVDLDALVARVRDPVTAAEVYGAAWLAIDVDTPAERAWLAMLAARLGLDDAATREIESTLSA